MLYLDDDILEALQKKGDQSGQGYQVLINEVLRDYLKSSQNPLNEESLRRILREEWLSLTWCEKKESYSVDVIF